MWAVTDDATWFVSGTGFRLMPSLEAMEAELTFPQFFHLFVGMQLCQRCALDGRVDALADAAAGRRLLHRRAVSQSFRVC